MFGNLFISSNNGSSIVFHACELYRTLIGFRRTTEATRLPVTIDIARSRVVDQAEIDKLPDETKQPREDKEGKIDRGKFLFIRRNVYNFGFENLFNHGYRPFQLSLHFPSSHRIFALIFIHNF